MAKSIEKPKTKKEVAVYGAFHLARICGSLITKDAWGNSNAVNTAALIREIEEKPRLLETTYAKALKILREIRTETKKQEPNPALYFKNNSVHNLIEQALDTAHNAANKDKGKSSHKSTK